MIAGPAKSSNGYNSLIPFGGGCSALGALDPVLGQELDQELDQERGQALESSAPLICINFACDVAFSACILRKSSAWFTC